ncbi:MAG: ABC transporter ATP-binding protein [Alphaproteobacteria bacterium]|nr:ABC transporter ATP-binding protein [Alphaproteobacteria bacterium]
MTSAAAIELASVSKRFGEHLAVDRLSMSVAEGEIVCLLGPSGCGKTTTLNIVAGFLDPDSGTVKLHGKPMNGVPPHRRNSGMVFQSYALFPHLSVLENVAFGLRARGVGGAEAQSRARETLALVRLDGLEARMPHQLSGGQQQRVSLARALVYRPEVLLLDEPFSNLDAKLRLSMREEVREIQRKVRVSALFVTHDQEEALHIADRIVVMNHGRIEQLGTPESVYFRPETRFVADFLGAANFAPVAVAGDALLEGPGGERWRATLNARQGAAAPARGTLMVRPERVRLLAEGDAPDNANTVPGRVLRTSFLGAHRITEVAVGDLLWRVREADTRQAARTAGEAVRLAWAAEDTVFLHD